MDSDRKTLRATALSIAKDTDGDAIVEATILFPIMIMIFAALVLLAIYLPTQATLQRATQHAATALAVEKSDTWLFFDESDMSYYWETDKSRLLNVYAAMFSDISDVVPRGEDIAAYVDSRTISPKAGGLAIDCYVDNKYVYKEIVITATREYAMPVNLSIISFPETLTITATSTAVVQDGDEFIRSMDLAVDFAEFISKKFGLDNVSDSIGKYWEKASSFFGW